MKPITSLLLVAAALAGYAVGATKPVTPYRLTGDELISQLIGQPAVPKADQTPIALYRQRYAEGYVDGVVDVTEGRIWCAPPNFGDRETDDRVIAALKKQAGTLSQNAARLLIDQFSQQFPCN